MSDNEGMFIDRDVLQRCKLVEQLIAGTESRSRVLVDRLRGAVGETRHDVAGLVRALGNALGDRAVEIRGAAAETLGCFGKAAQGFRGDVTAETTAAQSALLGALSDPAVEVRIRAVQALRGFAFHAADEIVPAVSRSTEDPDAGARNAAVDTLRSCALHAPVPVVRALTRVIAAPGNQDCDLVRRAIGGLRDCGLDAASEAVPALVGLVEDRRNAAETRTAACGVLAWLGEDARPAAAALVDVLLNGGADAPEMEVRVEAAKALLRIGSLLQLLADCHPEPSVRTEVLTVLRRIGPDATDARRALQIAWEEGPLTEEAGSSAAGKSETAGPQGDGPQGDGPTDRIAALEATTSEILDRLKTQQAGEVNKEWYTVKEVAQLTKYKKWTIRDACNKDRIPAEKSPDGQWRVSHDELVAIQNRGLSKERDVE